MINRMVLCVIIWIGFIMCACNSGESYNDGFIQYTSFQPSEIEKQYLLDRIQNLDKRYDSEGKMITRKIEGWNYHTDALSGMFHEVRASFNYAVALLDCGEERYEQRAFDVIEKTISLQDTELDSPSCGVWPYYEEEPLATKRSPIDYNWADFNAVSLLDIYMGHKDRLPKDLLRKVEDALVLAAKAVQKRNCRPSYTNIAIMGTYVTYMVSHLFDIQEMKEYAQVRLKEFYDYTLEKGGFSEYNSPTYSIVAIDELNRMQRHIVEPEAKRMIDGLYTRCWEIIARHYHKPSAQWAGPHSRSYNTLISSSYYGLLKKASEGKIDLGSESTGSDVKMTHRIPDNLLHYFLSPQYPRVEIDVFEKVEPQIVGTTFLTDKYAIGTVSRSSLWNQRRPLTAYWGELNAAHYLQFRFLHNFYDFSAASIFTQQKQNSVLSVVNIGIDGGDKHISIDRLREGKFKAKDLRLRFELGNCPDIFVNLPNKAGEAFTVLVEECKFVLRMLEARWDNLQGYWEKGGDGKNSWIDYVIYSGEDKMFNLKEVEEAVFAFALDFGNSSDDLSADGATVRKKGDKLNVSWDGLSLEVPIKPDKKPKNL